jgi:acetoin utilization protein AcuB
MKKKVLIHQIMRPPRPLVHLDMALSQILEILEKHQLDDIMVMEKGNLRGIVNKAEAMKALSPFIGTMAERKMDRTSLIRRAHQIMQHRYVKVYETDPIEQVAKKMFAEKVSIMPVMNDYENVSGFVTWRELYGHLLELAYQKTD